MIIVSMALRGELVSKDISIKVWTVRVDLNDTEDSWFYSTKKESKPTIEDIAELIGGDIKPSRISGVCIYEEDYFKMVKCDETINH